MKLNNTALGGNYYAVADRYMVLNNTALGGNYYVSADRDT